MKKMVQNQKGSALPIVLMVLMIVVIFSATALSLGSASTKHAEKQENKQQAYYLARSGAHAVASYIVDNPDSLTDSQMGAFVNNILTAGTSDSFKLDTNDTGEITVKVTKPAEDKLVVQANAAVSGITQGVSVDILVEKGTTAEFSKTVYSYGEMKIKGTVHGDIAGFSSVEVDWGGEINGTVYLAPDKDHSTVTVPRYSDLLKGEPEIANINGEIPQFPVKALPEFPTAPSISNTQNTVLSVTSGTHTIQNDRYYKSGINVSNGKLVIDKSGGRVIRTKNLKVSGGASVNDSGVGTLYIFVDDDLSVTANNNITFTIGDSDINIITNSFVFSPGNIIINRPAGKTGKLNIYVKNTMTLSSGGKLNYTGSKYGDPEIVNVYYAGANKLTLSSGSNLSATLYIDKADLELGGGHVLYGNIFSGGSKINISGGSSADVKLIYAPQAYVKLSGGGKVSGCIVSDFFDISGGASVEFKPLDIDVGDVSDSPSSKTIYKYGNWR